MNLEDLQSKYLKHSKNTKKDGSFRFDKSHLSMIVNYFISHNYTDTSEIDFDALYDFISYSRLRGNKNKTINKRINVLKLAIAFFVKLQMCEPNIITAFPKLSEQTERYDIVDVDDMRKVIRYLLNLDNSFMNLRNKVIVFLFIDTGARLNEVTNISISNIDTTKRVIGLEITKNSQFRNVYYSEVTAEYLNMYLDMIDDSSDQLLRNSKNNNPMNYLGVIRVIQKIRNETGLKKFSTHMIRHSYGTLAYELEVSEDFIDRSMGHNDKRMREVYQHYNTRKEKELYNKLSPMNFYTKIKKD